MRSRIATNSSCTGATWINAISSKFLNSRVAADGETYVAAVDAAQVVIREWIETAEESGRLIPEPKDRKLAYA